MHKASDMIQITPPISSRVIAETKGGGMTVEGDGFFPTNQVLWNVACEKKKTVEKIPPRLEPVTIWSGAGSQGPSAK